MKIHGYTVDAKYLVGRRFRFVGQRHYPEFTCVSVKNVNKATQISVHSTDGKSQFVLMSSLQKLIREGLIEEADGPPFTNAKYG